MAYDQIEGIARGDIRGLRIVGTNPAHSWINQRDARELLARLDFLVVQDMYTTTDTALLADLVPPAAGWGEKDGVFINSERRLGLIKAVARLRPGAQRLPHLPAHRRRLGVASSSRAGALEEVSACSSS
jgi:assimilatory nitrate reductase catalytic subunit